MMESDEVVGVSVAGEPRSERVGRGKSRKVSGKRQNFKNILLATTVFGLTAFLVGTILLCKYITIQGYEIVKDYTNCSRSETVPDQLKCKDKLNSTGKECNCYISIKIAEAMKGPVTIYYELESYEHLIKKYSLSRDDEQLAGHLSVEPSESCGSHTYACTAAGRKPIAPCGLLADAMLNDTFTMQKDNAYVNRSQTGLISEDYKKQFRNPDSAGNLCQAFEGFSKPLNWRKNACELDTINPDNNGFQNEAFIIWMKTDLKRKPAWRVKPEGEYKDGLPVGNYTLRVTYAYPPSRYDGQRKVIISCLQESVNLTQYGFGVALLVIGIPCSIFGGLLFILKWRK